MTEVFILTVKLIVLLLVLVVVFIVWGLCRAASERDRMEEEVERRRSNNG